MRQHTASSVPHQAARILCVVAVALVALTAIFFVLNWSTATETPRLEGAWGTIQIALWSALWMVFAVVGMLIIRRQPRNLIGWIFLWFALSGSLTSATSGYVLYGAVTEPGSLPAVAVVAWLESLLTETLLFSELSLLFLLIPTGRLVSPRWKPVAAATVIVAVMLVIGSFEPGQLTYYPLEDDAHLTNPFGIQATASVVSAMVGIAGFLNFILFVLSLAAPVVRFRRSRSIERQQMKWLALAGMVAFTVWGATAVIAAFGVPEDVFNVLVLSGFYAIPVATGIAILRHRLYDIDLVINRALVYGGLTLSLITVYLILVIGLSTAVRGLTGQSSSIVTAISTLAVAALFQPLRGGFQSAVDRRFYRRKYDAAKTLEAFSARLRDEIDLPMLSIVLRSAVVEAVQPAQVSLWLRPRSAPHKSGSTRR